MQVSGSKEFIIWSSKCKGPEADRGIFGVYAESSTSEDSMERRRQAW